MEPLKITVNISHRLATDEVVAHYRREGFAIIRGLLNGPELSLLRDVFDGLGSMRNNVVDKFARRLIVTRNLWQNNADVKALTLSLGGVAARMMRSQQVRLLD